MAFVVNPVIDIIYRLWDPITRLVRVITKLEENVQSLRTAKEDLIDARSSVKHKVDVAERRGLTPTPQVRRWLERVEATEAEVNEIENAFNQRRRCLGDYCPNCWSSYKLGKRVAKKLVHVAELKNNGVFSDVAEESLPDRVTGQPSTSAVGMDSTMEQVLRHLEEDDVGVIGLYGMGGVGKTTLLQKINNFFLQRSHDFDVVIWVVVSKSPNVGNIQKAIAKKLFLRENQDNGAEEILNALRKKKFLLLLDDIWERLDLEEVGIPRPNKQNKCKIIFTSRSKDVCGEMEAQKKIKVECLAWKEAWDLFREKVGEEAMNSHSEIPKLAETVAKECDGLPLGLITIGRAMACKTTPEEWKHAIAVLRQSASDFPGMEDQVIARLKLSYYNLSDDTLRKCFLYCSLFREDDHIEKDKLIYYWNGEGFLDSDGCCDGARNKGYDIIGRLKVACLLEDGFHPKYQVKMHDVIREMALSIASERGEGNDKFLVRAGVGLTEVPMLDKWKEMTRISLTDNELEALVETPTCPNLLTLLLQHNNNLYKISNNFFDDMPRLRVLNLSFSKLQKLPTGIGKLIELRYLNLMSTDIKTLPRELKNLVKLKHLNLSFISSLKTIPHKLIGGLSKLEVLNMYNSGCKVWKVEGYGDDGGGIDLAELECLKHLNDLGIAISTDVVLNKFLESQIMPKCTRKLEINNVSCFKPSSTFRNMQNVQELTFSNCNLEELIIDAEVENKDQFLSSLELLDVFNLQRLKTISVPRGFLKNLCNICIYRCYTLKNITCIVHLQSLEGIRVGECYEMEEVIGGDGADGREDELILLPNLKLIEIECLPKLKSICKGPSAFPSLQQLNVIGCPELKKLPLVPNNTSSLLIIEGEKEWWDGLEWKDEGIKSTFNPCFRELAPSLQT